MDEWKTGSLVWTFEEINHPLHVIFYNLKHTFGVIFSDSVFDSKKNRNVKQDAQPLPQKPNLKICFPFLLFDKKKPHSEP